MTYPPLVQPTLFVILQICFIPTIQASLSGHSYEDTYLDTFV